MYHSTSPVRLGRKEEREEGRKGERKLMGFGFVPWLEPQWQVLGPQEGSSPAVAWPASAVGRERPE